MYKWLCYLICHSLFFNFCFSQEFVDQTLELGLSHKYYGGYLAGGISFYDFNNDGWDDLSLTSGNGHYEFYQNNNGTLEEIELISTTADIKSFVWVDFDNDGDADLSFTELEGLFRLFENTGDLNLVEVPLNFPSNVSTFNSGISWGDFDQDGYLDFYVTRYPEIAFDIMEEAPNVLIKNNGDGTFSDVTDYYNIGNGYQHSFISTWADFDNDLDQDLYVVNDRFNFPNALYDNDDGMFSDIAEQTNSNLMVLAMSSTVGDYDNDADLDIYCTNTITGNHLLKNNGNSYFNDMFPYSGTELFQFSWGANWIDYDNNGWKDLFVCAGEFNPDNRNHLFINNQDGTFNPAENALDTLSHDSHGNAKGDINHDGLYDLAILNEAPDFSRILVNESSYDNNFIRLDLTGTVSNRDAVGSRILYYIDGQLHSEYTLCGSNYISQDSQHMILGMGQNSFIDSLEVTWPSGLKEWHYNIIQSTDLQLTEGSTLTATLSSSHSNVLCPDDQTELNLLETFDSIVWSNGTDSPTLVINEPETYWATVSITDQFSFNSDSITIEEGLASIIESVTTTNPSCFQASDGEVSVQCTLPDSEESFTWSSSGMSAGEYYDYIEVEGYCNAIVDYFLEEPSELVSIHSSTNAYCDNESLGSISFQSFGGIPDYEYSITPFFPQDAIPSGNYSFTTTDSNGCSYTEEFTIALEESLDYEIEVTHAIEEETGSIQIIVNSDTPISSIQITNSEGEQVSEDYLTPGDYTVSLIDENGCYYEEYIVISLVENIESFTKSDVILYPNPSTNDIQLINCQNFSRFRIYNLTGELVLSSNENATAYSEIDISTLLSGSYFIRFYCGSEPAETIHFIKL